MSSSWSLVASAPAMCAARASADSSSGPTQSVIIVRKSSSSFERCAGCQETLDPHALNVIAALTSPGSRALWSCHAPVPVALAGGIVFTPPPTPLLDVDPARGLRDPMGPGRGEPATSRDAGAGRPCCGEARGRAPNGAGAGDRTVPDQVALGYHSCFGTLDGWPSRQPPSLTGSVILLDAAVAASGRRVDSLHLPTLGSAEDASFAPLQDLGV